MCFLLTFPSLFMDHLILHLELHLRASLCGGLPSLLSGLAPAFPSLILIKLIVSLTLLFSVSYSVYKIELKLLPESSQFVLLSSQGVSGSS